jgi:DNA polymerase III subunit gamma/tau
VVFVLCTTEAHKIPATIASRCQHFSFRSVDFDDLVARMQWICEQEGIEADTECLALLAQTGEGSVRDSLSALDQAIACCGSKLAVQEVRALLGAVATELLEDLTKALAQGSSPRMLEIVDELERNGHNLQHFCRELARWFRNLLVTRIVGADTRLVAATPSQRETLTSLAAGFSEEDLTRYLQLTLDLFRDMQSSLQPRFHLEMGLVRLVQAGKLLPIEEALASIGKPEPPARASKLDRPPEPARMPDRTGSAPAGRMLSRSGPTPFELDRAKKASREPQAAAATAVAVAVEENQAPVAEIGWRESLHAVLMELGMKFTADAIEHSEIRESGNELLFVAPKEFQLSLTADDLQKALKHLNSRPMRVKFEFTDGVPTVTSEPLANRQQDDLESRVLAHPEVKRFLELFGGDVRQVRNLKE